jgi:DNA repair exonuclease SbcCD ATPase subunit
MRVIQLQAENIKRLVAIDITPQENVVVLSGPNGAGKTSALDCIWLALQYKAAKKGNPNPLRKGEKKGEITVDLGNYIVTRKFTESNTTLEVKTPDGSKISSPQKLLDGLIGDLSFDPWEFSRKTEKDQRAMLADVLYTITEGKLDLAGFDLKHQEAFDKRSEANREKKRLTALITQMAPPTSKDPTEEISITELTQSINDGLETKSNITKLTDREHSLSQRIGTLESELLSLKIEHQAVVEELSNMPEVPDVEYLKSELNDIENRNKRAREVMEYHKTRAAITTVDQEIKLHNDTMELVEIEKAEALENSPLPVKGLRVTPDGVMVINEQDQLVPFCQASAAQRLRISLGIAMAANPELRVIRISDGSLLDDNSMDIVREMTDDEDFQVWIEYASRNDQDRMGVYIEEGVVQN